MSYFIGSTLVFAKKFVDSVGADADPAAVRFYLREIIDGTFLEWVYDAVPVAGTHYPVGMNPVVKDSTGDYHVNYVARKAETHIGFWRGTGTVTDSGQTTYFVRHTDVTEIDDP